MYSRPLSSRGVGFVRCPEVSPISEVKCTECMLRSVGGRQFVHSTEVVKMSASWSVHYQWRFHCNILLSHTSCLKTTQNLEMTEIVYTYADYDLSNVLGHKTPW